VRARDEAGGGLAVTRPRVDALAEKKWVDRSRWKIRADVAHQLVAMGYVGLERTTRRAVGEGEARAVRRARPSAAAAVVEPGLWMQ
jgi:hypothetical protein